MELRIRKIRRNSRASAKTRASISGRTWAITKTRAIPKTLLCVRVCKHAFYYDPLLRHLVHIYLFANRGILFSHAGTLSTSHTLSVPMLLRFV